MFGSLRAGFSALLAVGLIGVFAVPGLAVEQDFKMTQVELHFISLEIVGDQLTIEAEGFGHSRLLGAVTTKTVVTQDLGPGCQPASGEITFFAEGGTIDLEFESIVCHTTIDGPWTVTGGTGEFAGITGGGTHTGSPSHSGHDPAVLHWEGTLDF